MSTDPASTVDDLLQRLEALHVRIWADGPVLRFAAPPGSLEDGLRDLMMEHKSELLDLLRSNGSGQSASDTPGLAEPAIPLSFEQSRLLFSSIYHNGKDFLHLPLAVRIRGELEVTKLTQSLRTLVDRHEILRTVYRRSPDGEWQQVVLPEPEWTLGHSLVEGGPAAENLQLAAQIAQLIREPFDLTTQLPLRARLFFLPASGEYVLVLIVHHIAADATSAVLLLEQLSQLYSARAETRKSTHHYAQYALAQQQLASAVHIDALTERYADRLRGLPAVHAVPLDRPRAAVRDEQSGAHHRLRIEAGVLEPLMQLCRTQNVSLFAALQAAFAVLLSRYSGEQDIVLGVPVDTRPASGFADVVGCFVNMVAVPTHVDPGIPFHVLLAQVQRSWGDVHEFRSIPLDRVIERLGLPRAVSHHPLFQITIGLQPRTAALRLPQLSCDPWPIDPVTSRYDLGLDLQLEGGSLLTRWEYDRTLFDEQTIQRMARHYRNVLVSICQTPSTLAGKLPMLEPDEGVFPRDARARQDPWPPEHSLGRHLELIAERHPDSCALVVGNQEYTYSQLLELARCAAVRLHQLGVRAGNRVGVTTEKVLGTYITLVAVIQLHAVYVPLDPSLPMERLQSMMDAADIHVAICGDALLAALPADPLVLTVHVAELLAPDTSGAGAAPPTPRRAEIDWPAYVMFTSGSAGKPKGVVVTQGAILRLARADERILIPGGGACLQASSLAFDASTYELWASWLGAGQVVVLTREELLDLTRLTELLDRRRIHTAFLTTALFNKLSDLAPSVLGRMQRILLGGEALSNTHVQRVRQACPDLQLISCYGPTENTTFSCLHTISCVDARPIPIGTALGDDRVLAVDSDLEPVPSGGAGELVVGGRGLALGYLGMPRLTAETFVPDPYGTQPGARLYRTRDRVRRHSLESYTFLGRLDRQVKLNGFRIELTEVEEWLRTVPQVRQAVVALRETAAGIRRLVAYVVLREPATLSAQEIRQQAFALAPDYIRPHQVITVGELPLNVNGKVDLSALPFDRPEEVLDAEPLTGLELRITEIWSEAAGIRVQEATADFFLHGGDSLGAMAACHMIHQKLGVEIPLRSFFRSPTPRGLAALIERSERSAPQPQIREVPL